MKKFIFLVALVAASISLNAAETIVWTGDTAISWNTEVYEGVQFETPEGIFVGLAIDDTIKVSVYAGLDEPQYVMTYKGGDAWSWRDLEDVSVADGLMTYVVAVDSLATWIAERGLIFRGQGYHMTQIVIASPEETPEPGPGDTTDLPAVPGAYETVLWQGDSAISWNSEVYAGGEFETAADLFAGLLPDDTIRVYTAEAVEGAQYNLTYKAGESWSWTELPTTVENGVINYIVASETIATEIAERGIIVRGQGYHMTYITVTTHSSDTVPPVDPQPTDSIDYTGLVETVVYAPESPVAISWDEASYPGIKLDTRNISETMFAGLQEGDVIRVTIVEAEDNAEYSMQYKAGDEWTWTDLSINLKTPGYMAYIVDSDDMAMLIADRGLVIQGIRYKVSGISVFGEEALPQGLEMTNDQLPMTNKVIMDGILLIRRGENLYNMQGQVVK